MYKIYAKYRDIAKLTDYQVAKECGFAQTTLSNWKQGLYEPKIDKLIKIAKVVRCPVEEITKAYKED